MKYLLLPLTLLFFTCIINAQEENSDYIDIGGDRKHPEIETFQHGDDHHGWVIGLNINYGQIEKENAIFSGFKAAYIMNRSLELGFSGTAFYSQQNHTEFFDDELNLIGGYGGLHIAPIIIPLKKVHVAFPIMLGAGAIGYDDEISGPQGRLFYENDWDEVFVGQIGATVVFNISRYFQIEVGANYLKTTDIELERVRNLNIDGFTGGFGFRFGRF